MRPGSDVLQDDGLEVSAGNTVEVEEDVVSVLSQVLEDSERPRRVDATITNEDGFLNAAHYSLLREPALIIDIVSVMHQAG
jgi:hypothetical protein